jgi:magnesium transporter
MNETMNASMQDVEVVVYDNVSLAKMGYSEYIALSGELRPSVTWINIDGVKDESLITSILRPFAIHPLIVEDILTPGQRPKIEAYDTYAYITAKMVYFNNDELIFEQQSILFNATHVITIGEKKGDVFDPIRKRGCFFRRA